MYTATKEKILEFITKNEQARPHDLLEFLQITPAALHRHLKKLCENNILRKLGKAPHVYYRIANVEKKLQELPSIPTSKIKFLEDRYLYISPKGEILRGFDGFQAWAQNIKEDHRISVLIDEYIHVRLEADKFFSQKRVDASERFQTIFKKLEFKKVFYMDFYSLPKFGKTNLGQLVLHGKQAQDKSIIQRIATECLPILLDICKKNKIEAIAWVPHSLPRKIPFLKEFEKKIQLPYPKIEVVKAYTGEIPIAQKSLSKLEERIQNAAETIMVKTLEIPFRRILLIDDAVGSGATLNEVAKKIRQRGAKEVFGFAIVGSYKGFEVIREV